MFHDCSDFTHKVDKIIYDRDFMFSRKHVVACNPNIRPSFMLSLPKRISISYNKLHVNAKLHKKSHNAVSKRDAMKSSSDNNVRYINYYSHVVLDVAYSNATIHLVF